MLRVEDLDHALDQFEGGVLTGEQLQEWADTLEMNDLVLYEEGAEGAIADLLFRLSTPEINDPITPTLAHAMRDSLRKWSAQEPTAAFVAHGEAMSGKQRTTAEVPVDHRSSDVRWLVIEPDADSGGWFLFGHRTLEEPSAFDSWHLTRQEARREAETQWGVCADDWRVG